MAAADAPLRTSMDSMSFGLRSDARLAYAVDASGNSDVLLVELSIGEPSTTNRGWPLPWIVLRPRMMIDDPAPGSPACEVMSTPGALAARAFTMLGSLEFVTCSLFTE